MRIIVIALRCQEILIDTPGLRCVANVKKNIPLVQMSAYNSALYIYYTKVYKNETAFRWEKNKPNSNPISKPPTFVFILL